MRSLVVTRVSTPTYPHIITPFVSSVSLHTFRRRFHARAARMRVSTDGTRARIASLRTSRAISATSNFTHPTIPRPGGSCPRASAEWATAWVEDGLSRHLRRRADRPSKRGGISHSRTKPHIQLYRTLQSSWTSKLVLISQAAMTADRSDEPARECSMGPAGF